MSSRTDTDVKKSLLNIGKLIKDVVVEDGQPKNTPADLSGSKSLRGNNLLSKQIENVKKIVDETKIADIAKIAGFDLEDEFEKIGGKLLKDLLPSGKSDVKDFLFTCNALDASAFNVARFEGTDGISVPFRFIVTLTSKQNDIDGDAVINKPATLFLKRYDEYCPYSGIVTSFKYIETNVDFSTYRIVLEPSLRQLSLNVQSRVFQKKSVPAIIEEVLKGAGLESSYYTLDIQSYPDREYVVQYQETDLNFISRLMEECGIWYVFKENPVSLDSVQDGTTCETMLITDKPANFRDIPGESTIKYRSLSGMTERIGDRDEESLYRFESERRLIPNEVIVKNFNYRTPEIDLSLGQPVCDGDCGKNYMYGGAFKDTTEAQKAAQLLSRRLNSGKIVFSGSGNCSVLRAGSRFTLEDHSRRDFNVTYVVTKITHTGADPDFDPKSRKKSYGNDIICIPSIQAELFAPECIAPIPKIPGITTATIEADGFDYATLDDKGRYKIRMPFDRSDTQNYDASKYIRLAQPYSGADYGIHFPSHKGTEMIVAHVDGDPNKPLGLGTVPNANTISPVKASNHTQGMVRSAGGNEIVFDDTDKNQRIAVYTPHDLSFVADHDETITIKHDRSKSVLRNEKNHIGGDKSNNIDGAFSEIVKLDADVKITEGNYLLDIVAGRSDTHVAGPVYKKYDTGMVTTVKNGILFESMEDDITINAATAIKFICGRSSMILNSDGTISIEGTRVAIKASEGLLSLDGVNTRLSARADVVIEGVNIGSIAKMSNNINGMLVASEGKTLNIVKGGMVQLNPPDSPSAAIKNRFISKVNKPSLSS
jgi:type VI secretion system secreted protein VgrG